MTDEWDAGIDDGAEGPGAKQGGSKGGGTGGKGACGGVNGSRADASLMCVRLSEMEWFVYVVNLGGRGGKQGSKRGGKGGKAG